MTLAECFNNISEAMAKDGYDFGAELLKAKSLDVSESPLEEGKKPMKFLDVSDPTNPDKTMVEVVNDK